jgi:hypothetical protein
MAVKRRTLKRRHDLDEHEENWLRNEEPSGFVQFLSEPELAKLWADHRDRIIAEHITEWPGTRPYRWWQRDAPEELGADETEVAYLERHGLLSVAERKRQGMLERCTSRMLSPT